MSTAQQTAETTGYTPISADDLSDAPELILESIACTATVSEISDPKITTSGTYERCTVKLKGTRGAQDFTTGFMFQPEWFVPGFEYKDLERGPGFVYKMNIGLAGAGKGGLLYTLVGSMGETPAAGWSLFKQALAARMNSVQRYLLTADEIVSVIRGLVASKSVELAYVKKQRTKETGESDEKGRAIRAREDGYEIDYFAPLTVEWIKAQVRRASNPGASFMVGFSVPVEAVV